MNFKRITRYIFLMLLSFCCFELIYFMRSTELSSENNKEQNSEVIPFHQLHDVNVPYEDDKLPLLLFWGKRWGGKEDWPPEGYKMDNCKVTYNRSKMSEARAIVFHSTTIKGSDFPWQYPRRYLIGIPHESVADGHLPDVTSWYQLQDLQAICKKPEQVYIWWNSETPSSVFQELESSQESIQPYNKEFFNWTMTYRLNADVVWGYGYRGDLLEKIPTGSDFVDRIISQKTKLVMWVASNCKYTESAKRRMVYVEEMLKSGIDITRKGSCFGEKIPDEQRDEDIRRHKFYLAFENANHCRDYITEKFWQMALENNAVPVVMGPSKEDVLKVAPLDSFIHADDFESPRQLAEYLISLDEDTTKYRKYFAWREDESITDEKMIPQIQAKYPSIDVQRKSKGLCQSVLDNKKTKTIMSLRDEIYANDPKECTDITS